MKGATVFVAAYCTVAWWISVITDELATALLIGVMTCVLGCAALFVAGAVRAHQDRLTWHDRDPARRAIDATSWER